MSFGNLFDASYWFSAPFAPSIRALVIMAIVFGLFIIFGAVAWHRRVHSPDGITRGVWRRFAAWAWTSGVIGFVFYFLRYERIIFFQNRFWLLAWFVMALVWFIFVLRHARHRAPALNQQSKEEAYKERYLPKSKR